MNLAVEKAKSTSIGVAIVRNSNHFEAASSHAMQAVAHNMIGFATTNGFGVNVAVFGAKSTSIGNNAFSFAIPAGKEPPIVLDMACRYRTKRKNLTFVRKSDIIMLSYLPPRVIEANTQLF